MDMKNEGLTIDKTLNGQVIKEFVYKGCKCYVKKMEFDFLGTFYNGYIERSLFVDKYVEPQDIHGDWTYRSDTLIGYDHAHGYDDIVNSTLEQTEQELKEVIDKAYRDELWEKSSNEIQ